MFLFFFVHDTAATEIYTLSLHDALPILSGEVDAAELEASDVAAVEGTPGIVVVHYPTRGFTFYEFNLDPEVTTKDRKSTRLNSSPANISYAVFCLKEKKQTHHLSGGHLC